MKNHEIGDHLKNRMRELINKLGVIDSNEGSPNENIHKKELVKERMSEIMVCASYHGLKEYVYGK